MSHQLQIKKQGITSMVIHKWLVGELIELTCVDIIGVL